MSHECEACGQGFETLSQLRLHECPSAEHAGAGELTSDSTTATNASPTQDSGGDRDALERDYPTIVGDLPACVAEARDGGLAEVARAIAEYEQVLGRADGADTPAGRDLQTDVLFAYYEPLANSLDAAARTGGWDELLEFADAYDPRDQDGFPPVGHVIANAIGRSVIRTRRSDGVAAIPDSALAFLAAIPEAVDEFHVAYEESYTYGWGIDHPEHSVADHLVDQARAAPKFVKLALNTAFYVDQHAAIDVFERIVTDDRLSGTRTALGRDIALTEFYFQAVVDLETEELLGPHAPPYWDAGDELARVIEIDPKVKQRIRTLALETGIATDLPTDWSLEDLDVGVMSGILDALDASSDRT